MKATILANLAEKSDSICIFFTLVFALIFVWLLVTKRKTTLDTVSTIVYGAILAVLIGLDVVCLSFTQSLVLVEFIERDTETCSVMIQTPAGATEIDDDDVYLDLLKCEPGDQFYAMKTSSPLLSGYVYYSDFVDANGVPFGDQDPQ